MVHSLKLFWRKEVKRAVQFFINLPWTMLGTLNAILSIPLSLEFVFDRLAIILWVNNIRFVSENVAGWTCGHIILLKTRVRTYDPQIVYELKLHELTHVDQFDRFWGAFPIFYAAEYLRKGYENNRFEVEARENAQKALS
jgi:hypothetical protein